MDIILQTILFTEDDWNTTNEGCIVESTFYSHRIRSNTYGTFWIAKQNTIIKN